MKVEVIRARPQSFESITLELPAGATLADAVRAAGWAEDPSITGSAVHGQRADASRELRAGDRVELLRPLQADPKDARRKRARAQKTP